MNEQAKDEVRTTTGASSCAPGSGGPGANASLALGYSAEDLAAVPEGANLGLGCGNPQAIAAFNAAFERAATACNGCHQASGHGFIEVPTTPGAPSRTWTRCDRRRHEAAAR